VRAEASREQRVEKAGNEAALKEEVEKREWIWAKRKSAVGARLERTTVQSPYAPRSEADGTSLIKMG
jgi:hypothetical protein